MYNIKKKDKSDKIKNEIFLQILTNYFQLENMTHDDLVKTNKKQLIFLQKLKAKCDDLQSKLSEQTDYVQVGFLDN